MTAPRRPLFVQVDLGFSDSEILQGFAEALLPHAPSGPAWSTDPVLRALWPELVQSLIVNLHGALLQHRPDGVTRDVTPGTLERWAHWTGTPEQFARAFRVWFTEGEDQAIPEWLARYGSLTRVREADRMRQQRYRQRLAAQQPPEHAPDTPPVTPNVTRDVTPDVAPGVTPQVTPPKVEGEGRRELPQQQQTDRVAAGCADPAVAPDVTPSVTPAVTRDNTGPDAAASADAPSVADRPSGPVVLPLRRDRELDRELDRVERTGAGVVAGVVAGAIGPQGRWVPPETGAMEPRDVARLNGPPAPQDDPKWQCNVLWERWRYLVGEIAYSNFAKHMKLPIRDYGLPALWQALDVLKEARATREDDERRWLGFQHWIGDLRRYVQLGAMDVHDANHSPTERGLYGAYWAPPLTQRRQG